MNKLLLLLGVIGIGVGSFFIYRYLYPTPPPASRSDLILGGACFAIALVCFAIFFFKRFRAEADQDISITKF